MRIVLFLCAACACAWCQQVVPMPRSKPPTPPTGNGVIEGTVVNAVTREPMNKIPVALWGMVSLNAVSDASGHFAFKDLAAGQYTVQVQQMNSRPDPHAMRSIHVGPDEHISDVTLQGTPPASLAGRVLDQDGSPVPHCMTSVMVITYRLGRRTVQNRASVMTDAFGQYEMSNLEPGRYYAMAVCHLQRPLPHAFMERNSPDIPMLRYVPQFYPGSATLTGASVITVAPGANVSGIDFRVASARGVLLKGRVTGFSAEAAEGHISVMLRPRGDVHVQPLDQGTRVDERTGIFQLRNVLPGSYDLIASISGGRQDYFAKLSVEIGSTPPEPLELELAPMPAVAGTIRIEGDTKAPLQQMNISLVPRDEPLAGFHGPLNAQPKEDGTFRFTSVPPGKYSLTVNAAAYTQSVQLNDHDVSPFDLEIPPGAPSGTLNIVMGTKWAEVDGSVAAEGQQGATTSGIIFRDDFEPEMGRSNRAFSLDPQGRFKLPDLAPGKYHACAVATEQPWLLFQNVEILKKLQSRCVAVEVGEGEHAKIQAPMISSDDLEKLSADLETP